jgi:hypothetical protein
LKVFFQKARFSSFSGIYYAEIPSSIVTIPRGIEIFLKTVESTNPVRFEIFAKKCPEIPHGLAAKHLKL